jgi:hypothetical protein
MIFLDLLRLEMNCTETVGVLMLNKKLFCYILEPPKKDNKRGESCIPTGQYICKRYNSTKYGYPCLQVLNVANRDYIAIHAGNTVKDTKGCLIPGTYTGYINKVRAVLRSKAAHDALMSEIIDECHLTIREI